MRVRFTHQAVRQFDYILADLNQLNPAAAKNLRKRAQDIQARIGQFPDAFQEVDARKGVRCVPLTPYPYVVFYRVLADEVEVVAVVHGARKEPWENL